METCMVYVWDMYRVCTGYVWNLLRPPGRRGGPGGLRQASRIACLPNRIPSSGAQAVLHPGGEHTQLQICGNFFFPELSCRRYDNVRNAVSLKTGIDNIKANGLKRGGGGFLKVSFATGAYDHSRRQLETAKAVWQLVRNRQASQPAKTANPK